MNEKKEIKYFTIDPNIEYVKIFGLQRSGTNYLTYLINENFESTKAIVNVGGWKHGYYSVPWIMGKEINVLAITKNPYAWLVSMYNYWGPNKQLNIGPNLQGVSFEHFVKNKTIFEKQKNIPYLLRSENPIQHWNNMNFHWLSISLNSKKLFFITYEMLLRDLENTLTLIGKALILNKKKETKTVAKVLFPAGEEIEKSNDNFEKTEYYLQNKFLIHYTPELLDFVNDQLDLELMIRFGYNVLTQEDLETVRNAK